MTTHIFNSRVALTLAGLVLALGILGCAAPPPKFRPNLVQAKTAGAEKVTLASTPEVDLPTPDKAPVAGGKDPNAALEQAYGMKLSDDAGKAVIESVVADKPAASAGLMWGDVITSINGSSISDRPAAVKALLEQATWGKPMKVKVDRQQGQQIANLLLAVFGTPDHPERVSADGSPDPTLLKSFGFDIDKLQVSAGRVYSEQSGRQHGLYRLHCAHCHGISGDGAGPTAAFLNPYPRDYRQGKFKFKSTLGAEKPTHADLMRILTDGVPGTAMPSFRILPENEREALVEYVEYLSVRGETEIKLIDRAARGETIPTPAELAGGGPLVPDAEGNVTEPQDENNIVAGVVYTWRMADKKIVAPVAPSEEMTKWLAGEMPKNADGSPASADSPAEKRRLASLARGQAMFYGTAANCFSCHGDSQLGDGQTTDYDFWFQWRKSLDTKPAADRDKVIAEFEALGALPPRNIKPRDLRAGVYRGGRRPLDIYRRIFSGINGTPMPAISVLPAGAAPDPKKGVTTQEIWDLVHFVKSLPYQPLSQPPEQLEALREHQIQ
ncbi:MAG: c-type cytochrome [Planctomycetia bacterium]|nr:c-type cytochrome [Planctomycetia bacterium]